MENYKTKWTNPETFEEKEIETSIPVELVKQMTVFLQNLNEENWIATPIMVDPEKSSVVFGIMEKNKADFNSIRLKYKVSITPNN